MRSSVDLPQPDGPDQHHELAVGNVNRHALQCMEGTIVLARLVDVHICHECSPPPGVRPLQWADLPHSGRAMQDESS